VIGGTVALCILNEGNNSVTSTSGNLFAGAARDARSFSSRVWVVALLFFATATLLYTRQNEFPFTYHPNESGKVEQVLEGERNFRHPLLLVNTTALAAWLRGADRSPQAVALVGRNCSAIFAALAVSALAWLAYRQAGLTATICAGLIVMLHPQIFELAHYMKEDTALLAGLALFLLALDCFWRRRSRGTALALGAASGLAASGKYLGASAVLVGLAFVLWPKPQEGRWAGLPRSGFFLLGCLACLLVINWQGWAHPASWNAGLQDEFDVLFPELHHPASLRAFRVLRELVFPGVWVLLALHVFHCSRHRTQTSAPQWLLLAWPFLYVAALAVMGRETTRYFLPAVVLINFQAGLGLAETATQLSSGWRMRRPILPFLGLIALGLALVLPNQSMRLAQTLAAFSTDHRKDLVRYLNDSVPGPAVIVAEWRSGLQSQTSITPRHAVMSRAFADEVGTIEEMRRGGVTHVVVGEDNYRKYFGRRWVSSPTGAEAASKRRAFYRQLFAEGHLVFERKRQTVSVLNPGLRLYQIAR